MITGKKYIELHSNPASVNVGDIPDLEYSVFANQTIELLKKSSCHCVNYFTVKVADTIRFLIIIANDDAHKLYVYAHCQPEGIKSLDSITRNCFQMHVFERDIHERTGINFEGHPWQKPLRYPAGRYDIESKMSDYPFYTIESEELHEVGVGPIHAGVIEPGHFRFQCYGEKVIHLEIQLGYQHRGVEKLFTGDRGLLNQSILSESIAGDTAIGHAIAFSQLAESLSGTAIPGHLEKERIIALEMERMAIHIGDTAALCGDVAYQIGQVTCEALRTLVINTTQDWCGNRFGKGLIRPGGTNYPLTPDEIGLITTRLTEIKRRYFEVSDLIFNNSGIQSRFEGTGTVSKQQTLLAGAVGMAARSSGLTRDIRKSHPFQAYKDIAYLPAQLERGDVYARAFMRRVEFRLSYDVVMKLLEQLEAKYEWHEQKPAYSLKYKPSNLCISMTEGWRGEICHSAVTDETGNILEYRIKDPSLHNWYILALAVRGQEISDFPICNKSFNLSYCGNDL